MGLVWRNIWRIRGEEDEIEKGLRAAIKKTYFKLNFERKG